MMKTTERVFAFMLLPQVYWTILGYEIEGPATEALFWVVSGISIIGIVGMVTIQFVRRR